MSQRDLDAEIEMMTAAQLAPDDASASDGSQPSRTARMAPELRGMGARLRGGRQAKAMSLRDLSEQVGVSPSLISQVETGRASPSVATLYAIASALDLSVDDVLFGAGNATGADGPVLVGPVQRVDGRKQIRLASGVIWERLTTTSDDEVEFLHVIYEVGGASGVGNAFQRHAGHEYGYVLSGRLHVTIAFEDYVLEAGDSISIDSTVPHRLWNDGAIPVHGIWFVLGRHDDHRFTAEGDGAT